MYYKKDHIKKTGNIGLKIKVSCLLILIMSVISNAQSQHYINSSLELKAIIGKNAIDTNSLSLVIDKSDYKLTVMSGTLVLKEYPVVFGRNPVNDKLMQGDTCTPEGTFFMKAKYAHLKWSKFIWINYPNEDSWRKHLSAIQQGKIPVNAKIGGEIGIHGVPEDMDFMIDLHYNWTAGCISMKNKDINEIYQYVSRSTPIIIKK
jgi:murein L,D-transpeptidase YafK